MWRGSAPWLSHPASTLPHLKDEGIMVRDAEVGRMMPCSAEMRCARTWWLLWWLRISGNAWIPLEARVHRAIRVVIHVC